MSLSHWILGVFLLFVILIGLVWQFTDLPDAKARIESLPLNGKNLSGYDVPLTPSEEAFFKGVNAIKRIYKVGNQTFFLYALDGTHNRHAVHDPTYCFKGSGWDITNEKNFPLKDGSGLLFTLNKGYQTKEALVWFSDGVHNYNSPFKYWLATTLRRLTLGRSGAEPVLVSIQPLLTKTLDWNEIFKQFPELNNL